MARTRQVPGGGRAVEVSPERVAGWFERFADRNDGVSHTRVSGTTFTVTAGNKVTASIEIPFPPMEAEGSHAGLVIAPLLAHLAVSRRVGLVLMRLGAHSIGVAVDGSVVASRTDRHLVHGRNSAGGWSQQRFARRRAEQARYAVHSAASDIADVLGSRVAELNAVVLGGDRRALDQLRSDDRLAAVFELATGPVLDCGEPRRATLDEVARRARAVEIVVRV